ncbi:sugar ABC transporter ATP-binding protein [Pararhizobium mangrovi]|uniref:sugar ABC transporter ATP-binding protein n=1 Tax=Pararhizobium mangrovi TaxID=2590452 RepID=UPI001AEE704F|nr:sugar ABC transporter ATP-binding protein [Pararhizobium mangrovi]
MAASQLQDTDEAVLVLDNVSKGFSGVQALDAVTLRARAGEVLALMGENGAGKSTLLKIMSAAHAADSGRIVLDGNEVSFASPVDARRNGIRVVAQEPEIMGNLSVAENVYVGALPRNGRLVDRARLFEMARSDIERAGFSGLLDPRAYGRDLSPAQRQIVEILRALVGKPRVIAFDEPTSSLSDHEAEALFHLIGRLCEDGIAVIYVSHRMKEIFRVATRVLVLRDGRVVGERPADETDDSELVRMMVGRDLSTLFHHTSHEPGRPILSLRNLTSADVHDVSFDVHAGEVVVLAGLVGAGRTELARAIIGDLPVTGGTILVDGEEMKPTSPRDAIRAGLCLAPEERKTQALLMKRSVKDNISLAIVGQLSRWHVIRRRQEREVAARHARRLSVRTPNLDNEVSKLSGGNQQKVVLARWLARRSKLLILDEPTRGVDVGAKADIYAIIDQLAAEGAAVLVISSELPEVLGLADRIVVMQRGRVSGELGRDEASEENILGLSILEEEAA